MQKPDDPTNCTDPQTGEGFLGRWSRRKRAGGDGQAAQAPGDDAPDPSTLPPAQPGAAADPVSSTPVATSDAAPPLTDADMPDLASIGDDGDYSGFLSPGVSEALRNKALRQLFMSAKFNELDGLNDYDDDFTSFEPLGDIVTSDMRHRAAMEAERALQEAQAKALAQREPVPPPPAAEAAGQRAIGRHEPGPEGSDEHAPEAAAVDADGAAPDSERQLRATDAAAAQAGDDGCRDEASEDGAAELAPRPRALATPAPRSRSQDA